MAAPNQEDRFALAKLGDLASINLDRLLSYPPEVSGWTPLISELISTLSSTSNTAPVRSRAADTLVRLLLDVANAVAGQPEDARGHIQTRLLEALRNALLPLQIEDRDVSVTSYSTDVDIHKIMLEGLKNILESGGEALVSGWDIIFEIIDTIFTTQSLSYKRNAAVLGQTCLDDAVGQADPPLIRFSAANMLRFPLFFTAELLLSQSRRIPSTIFALQDDELNIALTVGQSRSDGRIMSNQKQDCDLLLGNLRISSPGRAIPWP